jgi:ribulose-5-phosphate 4-epimerase/fuculose-1-phosphate aldolase
MTARQEFMRAARSRQDTPRIREGTPRIRQETPPPRLGSGRKPRSISGEEWRLRCDLAACYQLVDLYGMTDLSSNHISVRVPGLRDQFLLNPLGLMYDQITASSLIKVDVDGRVIDGDPRLLNPAGFVIHSAVHMAQRELVCVLHTHTRANNAVAALKEGLLPLTQKALSVLSHVRYHDYEGPSTHNDERERIAKDLGRKGARVMILRNHGALTFGRSIAEAFVWMHRFETACTYQVDALASAAAGYKLNLPSAKIARQAMERSSKVILSGGIMETGSTEWSSLLRKLERERGTSYRT